MPADTTFKDPALAAERLPLVRDHIASLPAERFNMGVYFGYLDEDGLVADAPTARTNAEAFEGSCGSCACIAGHALVALEPDAPQPASPMFRAAALLGLSGSQAEMLFEPNNFDLWFSRNLWLSDVSQADALRVLDHLIATGEVDWSVARKVEA